MTTVLKLGGSVITEKGKAETIDGDSLDRAAEAIGRATASGDGSGSPGATGEGLVLVHGGGSFGHYHADRRGVTTTEGTHETSAVMDIHSAMTTLNRVVLRRLQDRDVPALPVHPLSTAARGAGGDLDLPTTQVETMLDEAFVPVIHGDAVAHEGTGVTVLSGDEVSVELAGALGADRVGTCSTVPGVLDADGTVIERIEDYAAVADAVGDSEATDVTGGMAGKVRALLDLDAPAWVFDLNGLAAFLAGCSPGTRIGDDGER